MIESIIRFSIRQRLVVILLSFAWMLAGLYGLLHLPVEAVPDVTNRQVQLNAKASGLGPEEMERLVTFPLELALAGLPGVEEVRSLSQFGLSQITLIFSDSTDPYFARQQVNERLPEARQDLPENVSLEMAPVSTGLGEILYLRIDNPELDLMEKRTLLDWVVRPQLRNLKGLAEVNTWGGLVRRIQIEVDPLRLAAHELTFQDVVQAVAESNANAGGGFIQRGAEQQNVRTIGLYRDLQDIGQTVVRAEGGRAITVAQIAQLGEGASPRQGALTRDGEGEDAYAIAMLLMGENGREVVQRVKARLPQIESSLPAGSKMVGFLDRTELIDRTLQTALKNLTEGGILVVLLLFLFLAQLRAGLIVSSAIPLSMLFAVVGMNYFGISANLMSLGAIDLGLIVDGAVIIVENCVRRLGLEHHRLQRPLSESERLEVITEASVEVRGATQFGEMIILASYLPILSLEGMEGRMFRPMGLTVVLALSGAMVLSFTLIPALCALFLRPPKSTQAGWMQSLQRLYAGLLERCLVRPALILLPAGFLLMLALSLLGRLGGEFIPELEEGSLAIQATYLPGSSLDHVVERATILERALVEGFPDEVAAVVSRIGRPEIATDPMQVFQVDTLIALHPRGQWKKARSQAELSRKVSEALESLPAVSLSFSQPIKMRMMELIEGVGIRSDLGIKLFGPDPEVLHSRAQQIAVLVGKVAGARDVSVEATTGLPNLELEIRRNQAAQLGVRVQEINQVIEAALGGKTVTQINDGHRRIDVAVVLPEEKRTQMRWLELLQVPAESGELVPLSALCHFRESSGPAQISRENGQRRIVIQANVTDRDLASFVHDVQKQIQSNLQLPAGYYLQYGGTFEKMQSGRARLAVVVPLTVLLVLGLLFITFQSLSDALMVFVGVPLAACGGILALWLRGMTLSISALIGFIALAGVAVLNGVVMLHFIRNLRAAGRSPRDSAMEGAVERLRPVLMTASVAGFGFVPMALSTGAGAEVQRPLATVVIGGLLTSSLLTLLILPVIWCSWQSRRKRPEH